HPEFPDLAGHGAAGTFPVKTSPRGPAGGSQSLREARAMPGVTRLSVRNIRKSFGSHEVLRGISLDAQDGDVISLLGASGSGKSTFLRCINLLETASDGEVFVDGEQIRMVHKN